MSDTEFIRFLQLARDTAVSMLENARYIQKELPTVFLPDQLRKKIEIACEAFNGTKHDVMHEIFEYQAEQGTSKTTKENFMFGERIIRWLLEPLAEMHEAISEIEKLSEKDARYMLAFILLMESTTNVFDHFKSNKRCV